MAGAVLFAALFLWLVPGLLPEPAATSMGEQLTYALRWELLPGATLLLGIALIARRRFFDERIIEGGPAPQAPGEPLPALEIDLRYLRNTLEQVALAFVGHMALATLLNGDSLRVLGALAILFVIGRVTFRIGYAISPVARAFGFAATFYPTIGVYLYCCWKLVR
ncbi:MAG: MAPEG family protein [Planctomycetes bacterium]|nr:MAPEG family protein [Planctomycetota bacterium]MCB0221339.1 MAPEG family protein [Chrysiogenetes bacterium]